METTENFLVVDIGNTRIKIAVFRNDKIVFEDVYSKVLVRDIKKIAEKFPFQHAVFSSVRDKKPPFIRHLANNFKLYEFNQHIPIPLVNSYKTPETLGMDRLASAVGAYNKFPGENILIIDLGTCIKYDFVSSKGKYLGGNIAPGLEMRLESMHAMTAVLPRERAKFNKSMLGKSTSEALQNGAVWGIKLEIEKFIETLTAKQGEFHVILSGGDSKYFGEILESRIFVLPELVLFGLYETLKYNILKSGR